MASKGLYKTAFSSTGLSKEQENFRWKREEDEYLMQLGMMPLIQRDPNAAMGYEAQQSPEGYGLMIDPFTDSGNLGQYAFNPDRENEGIRRGQLSIRTSQPTTDWGETLVHELGHAGSRNLQTESSAYDSFLSGAEEERQRFMDYILHPETSALHRDAKRVLEPKYGDRLDEQAEVYRRMLIESTPKPYKEDADPKPPRPRPKPQGNEKSATPKKKKKRYLVDFLK
jgi:hypothetical protein